MQSRCDECADAVRDRSTASGAGATSGRGLRSARTSSGANTTGSHRAIRATPDAIPRVRVRHRFGDLEQRELGGAPCRPLPSLGTPPPIAHCEGGTDFLGGCYSGSGQRGGVELVEPQRWVRNPTNGDLADLSDLHDPGNCWHGNTDPAGVTSAPADLQVSHAACGVPNAGEAVLGSELSDQVLCATELLGPCTPGVGSYPHGGTVVMPPLARQATMPDPCRGVPANAWCPGGRQRNDSPTPAIRNVDRAQRRVSRVSSRW